MRKLIVSLNITLDGFIAGPHHELDWHFKYWSDSMGEGLCELLAGAGTILLGRKTYECMVSDWLSKEMDPLCRGIDFIVANKMNSTEKVIFSRTLLKPPGNNVRLARCPAEKEIRDLKTAKGNDLLVLGSGELVSFLTRENLVDEYQLWVHPILLGRGKRFTYHIRGTRGLQLKQLSRIEEGVSRMVFTVG
jgi:dihydrofolate reductase